MEMSIILRGMGLTQSLVFVMAGLDPAIHVFLCNQDVDGRHIGERSDAVLRTLWPGMTRCVECEA
jgi:hypothetical protein